MNKTIIKLGLARLWIRAQASVIAVGWSRVAAVETALGMEGVLSLLELASGESATRILHAKGAQIGQRVRILRGLTIHNADKGFANLHIGEACHVGRQVLLDLAAPIQIGNRVTIAMRSMILTHADPGDSRSAPARDACRRASVVIEDDVYVGAGAIILPGVRIGYSAVIGAGAVVANDIEDQTVVVGVPARPISRSARAER